MREPRRRELIEEDNQRQASRENVETVLPAVDVVEAGAAGLAPNSEGAAGAAGGERQRKLPVMV